MKLSDWPSLRLVLPLIAGILISDSMENAAAVVSLACVLLVPVLLTAFISLLYGGRLARTYGLSLSLALFLLGAGLYALHECKVHVEWPHEPRTYSGMITDYPQEKARSYRLDVQLRDSAYMGRNIILYVPKDSCAEVACPGQTVSFRGRVEKPHNGDSLDFDYASYLYRHDISGTLWVSADNWRIGESQEEPPLRIRAVRLCRGMARKYAEWGLEGNALAVVCAVTLGSRRELGADLKQTYSTAGASHVLAVSGLHVGIMCSFLYLLLPSFLFRRRMAWVRELAVMGIMWTYAFLIGLPMSITRSLIMFTMLAVCRAAGRESQSVNTLAFAAFVILLVQPQGLFDISFQLSFTAVLAILLFEPGIRPLLSLKTAVGKYLWGIVAVSLAAQIGTAPLVMYSFSNFSTYFLLTNIIVIPLMFAVVYLSVIMWMVSFMPFLRSAAVWCITRIVNLVNLCLEGIVSLPFSSLTVRIDAADVWLAYALILLIYAWLVRHRTRYLTYALGCVAVWSAAMLIKAL